jgi:hypothetical protein
MFFTRTHKYHSSVRKEEFKNNLIGKHVKIHNLDFEVFEKDNQLRIIPHAEQINDIKTLPITQVDLKEEGNKTKVIITSKMRKFDSGGPQLVVIFCGFLLGAAVTFQYLSGDKLVTYILLGVDAFVFTLFCVRMQMGYFDYIRKIRAYIKSKGEEIAKTSTSNISVLQA